MGLADYWEQAKKNEQNRHKQDPTLEKIGNALLAGGVAYLTGGLGSALLDTTGIAGAKTAFDIGKVFEPSKLAIVSALETGVGAYNQDLSAPNAALEYGVQKGMARPIEKFKQSAISDENTKIMSKYLTEHPNLEETGVTVKDGIVAHTYGRKKTVSTKITDPSQLSGEGKIAYQGVMQLAKTGKTQDAINRLKALNLPIVESNLILKSIPREWKSTTNKKTGTINPILDKLNKINFD